jgi:putative N6-adenine-specific DNA methylase
MRHFRIESLPFFERGLFESVKKEAKTKIYPSGAYTLIGHDIDETVLELARENAKRAGVAEDISWRRKDYVEDTPTEAETIITNPPYGKRLMGENLDEIYAKLVREISHQEGG